MANKDELKAQIVALEAALTEAGVEFAAVDQSATNDVLAQEITRLESLLPEDGTDTDTNTDKGTDTDLSAGATADDKTASSETSTETEATNTRKVLIKKGVNVEIKLDNKPTVLKSEKEYDLPAERAKSIVAENLGRYADE